MPAYRNVWSYFRRRNRRDRPYSEEYYGTLFWWYRLPKASLELVSQIFRKQVPGHFKRTSVYAEELNQLVSKYERTEKYRWLVIRKRIIYPNGTSDEALVAKIHIRPGQLEKERPISIASRIAEAVARAVRGLVEA